MVVAGLDTTWALVSTRPSSEMITPEPAEPNTPALLCWPVWIDTTDGWTLRSSAWMSSGGAPDGRGAGAAGRRRSRPRSSNVRTITRGGHHHARSRPANAAHSRRATEPGPLRWGLRPGRERRKGRKWGHRAAPSRHLRGGEGERLARQAAHGGRQREARQRTVDDGVTPNPCGSWSVTIAPFSRPFRQNVRRFVARTDAGATVRTRNQRVRSLAGNYICLGSVEPRRQRRRHG